MLYLELADTELGLRGYGEAAPLPVFGTESLAQAADILRPTDDGVPPVLGLSRTLFPASSFAVECATLDLLARRADVPLARFLGSERNGVPVNAIVAADSPADAAESARAAVDRGFGCIKLKVGRPELSDDIALCTAVRAAVGDSMRLRLDANGAWPLPDALRAFAALQEFSPEYIEQPLPPQDWHLIAELRASSAIPIAADESATDLSAARRMLRDDTADVFVLKPMAAGSLLACRDFALDAIASGKDVVFTSLLDSALGRTAVAHLCATVPGTRAHGLATGGYFREDASRDRIVDGVFLLPDAPGIGIDPLPGVQA